ncbi:hypothetical protein J3R30DRAFT_3736297 [Lentinula aciculospora]|uniref:Uncharacterized protein n=1 Tax=Lentinula aciculospora TaxID=153920 RepID=A0A9W9DJQ4_9AGAR|nr:hypothetical protein J3R30DRAFT_3736297 [Lentinula aciculospora]
MPLETGLYTIKNGDKVVGPSLVQDLGLLPKKIIVAPSGNESVVSQLLACLQWLPSCTYRRPCLRLIHRDLFTKWVIKAVPQQGKDAYTAGKLKGTIPDDALMAPFRYHTEHS